MTIKLPVHVGLDGFDVHNNCLTIAGQNVADIHRKLGGGPAYIYDSQLIRARVDHLRAVLPPAVSLHYAMKANPMPEVVNLLSQLVDGIDVASSGELSVALGCQVAPKDISFAGPGKRDAELADAILAGIVLNVESEGELRRASAIAEKLQRSANVALRVNPDFELKGSGMRMSGGPKPFGIDAEKVPALLGEMDSLNVEFQGFHIFSGSQNLRPASICEAQTKTIELALQLASHGPAPRFVNIGGGFGIPYFPGDEPLDLKPVAENLERQIHVLHKKHPDVEVVIELGRYLVGEAGVYVCQVIDKKESRGHTYLIADGGLHHHLALSGNFGQVLRKNYPVLIGNRVSHNQMETVSIVGPLCTPLDILADRMSLPAASVGDLIVVMQSGAYGYTASPRDFLGHPPPKEVLL